MEKLAPIFIGIVVLALGALHFFDKDVNGRDPGEATQEQLDEAYQRGRDDMSDEMVSKEVTLYDGVFAKIVERDQYDLTFDIYNPETEQIIVRQEPRYALTLRVLVSEDTYSAFTDEEFVIIERWCKTYQLPTIPEEY